MTIVDEVRVVQALGSVDRVTDTCLEIVSLLYVGRPQVEPDAVCAVIILPQLDFYTSICAKYRNYTRGN